MGSRATIVIVGGTGFLGTALTRHFTARGVSVFPVGRSRDGNPLSPSTVPLAELLYHCAGSASVGAAERDPAASVLDDVGSLAASLELCRRHPRRPRLVLVSSAAIYGNAAPSAIPEDTPCEPISVYGTSKQLAETYCRWFGARYGVDTAIVRFFSLYGPELRKQIFWDACRKLEGTAPVVFTGTGDEQRDFLHVRDAAALLERAAESASLRCPVVNGGTGIATSIASLVTRLRAALAISAAFSFDGTVPADSPRRLVADVTRARALGFAPSVSLDAGIAEFAAWFRAASRLSAVG